MIRDTETEPITWVVEEKIACFSISLLTFEEFKTTHKLTLVLYYLVKFLVLGFKAI